MTAAPAAGLADGVLAGDRRVLAQAITLIESTRPDHRAEAEDLLEQVLPQSGGAIRLGISGSPGVGKSTFIEALGLFLIEAGQRIAVLAVDPSSQRSKGSILGDKTRMEELARADAAFIRPSPAGGILGGVARRSREAVLLCEAAGFDVVIIETVGVGQSETAVADMADMFVLLLQPGAGDELQGFKRGIVELADLFVVTKADGELLDPAARATAAYQGALGFLRPANPAWRPPVLKCSAVTGDGVPEIWAAVTRYRDIMTASGDLTAKRAAQARAWMWRDVSDTVLADLRGHPDVARQLAGLEAAVMDGRMSPSAAARRLLQAFIGAGGRDSG